MKQKIMNLIQERVRECDAEAERLRTGISSAAYATRCNELNRLLTHIEKL